MRNVLTIEAGKRFSFWRTVFSHGWCALPPFYVDKADRSLSRVLRLENGRTVLLRMEEVPGGIRVSSPGSVKCDARFRKDAGRQIADCFRIGEDFSDFYREARRLTGYRWIARSGAGRLLRAPTVFEDVVKMICTTNCSWALTEIMVGNLCAKLGEEAEGGRFAFPTARAIARSGEAYLRKEIKTGYRSPYLLEFARRVDRGEIDPESWRSSPLPTDEIFAQVKDVKGIGPYAAGNIMKLLGRYDYLGIDSWCRAKFFELHRNGRKGPDRIIERFYEPFGKWRGLFFWLDVTKEWYRQKFPF